MAAFCAATRYALLTLSSNDASNPTYAALLAEYSSTKYASITAYADTTNQYVQVNINGTTFNLSAASGGSQMRVNGLPFPFSPDMLSCLPDVTVAGNTTYSTDAQRVQVCKTFTISGALPLTAQ